MLPLFPICKLVQLAAEGGAVRRFIFSIEAASQLEHRGGAFQMHRPIVPIEAHSLRKAPSVVESEAGAEALGRAADVTVKGRLNGADLEPVDIITFGRCAGRLSRGSPDA